jgi:hypothetical protein
MEPVNYGSPQSGPTNQNIPPGAHLLNVGSTVTAIGQDAYYASKSLSLLY